MENGSDIRRCIYCSIVLEFIFMFGGSFKQYLSDFLQRQCKQIYTVTLQEVDEISSKPTYLRRHPKDEY